jgi:hypothetical protein
MKLTRRIIVTKTERHSIGSGSAPVLAPCPKCQANVEALTSDEAACILQIPPIHLEHLIGSGQVHSIGLTGGGRRICRRSLFTGDSGEDSL